MADQAFAAGDSFERYPFDGAARLQQRLRQLPQHAQVAVNPTDLKIFGTDAVTATEAQWMLVQRLQAAFADATVTLQQHHRMERRFGGSYAHNVGVIVTQKLARSTCAGSMRRPRSNSHGQLRGQPRRSHRARISGSTT